jgi:hypothetical protein
MNKFSILVENVESQQYFKIKSEIDLIVEASSEGEASYIADSTLASVKGQSGYNISSVEQTNKEEFSELMENNVLRDPFGRPVFVSQDSQEETEEEKVLNYWEALFGDKMPTATEKLEFYHRMRTAGHDGILIHKVMNDKLLGKK